MIKTLDGLVKIAQTSALVLGGLLSCFVAGSCKSPLELLLALSLDISGTTMLNMLIDKDIDKIMERTKNRPIPSGRVNERLVMLLSLVLIGLGIGIAFSINTLTGAAAFLGTFIDSVLYSYILKRRKWYSPVVGGVAGAMPFVGGWFAGGGDLLGLFFIPSITAWSCAHIWALSAWHHEDYRKANIPTLFSVFGPRKFKFMSTLSIFIASLSLLPLLKVFSLLLLLPSIAYGYYVSKGKFDKAFKSASTWLISLYIALALVLIHRR